MNEYECTLDNLLPTCISVQVNPTAVVGKRVVFVFLWEFIVLVVRGKVLSSKFRSILPG